MEENVPLKIQLLQRGREVSLWQAQIEWAICRTNWCLKSLQDLIGLKEEPGNG